MINKLLRDAEKRLQNISDSPLLDARVFLSYATNTSHIELIYRELTEKELSDFNSMVELREKGLPVAYIVGEKEFMSLPFYVDNSTLIPRPDTEIIVENMIEIFKNKSPKILDLCTGSGCIGISLAKYIDDSVVTISDLSSAALSIAKKNILRHNLADRVTIETINVLTDDFPSGFDLIVANPPYIKSNIVSTLEVAKSEPMLALDGGMDGLDFYRAIIPKAYNSLNKDGILAFEIGFDQSEALKQLMSNRFDNITLKKDYGNNYRLIYGTKKALL